MKRLLAIVAAALVATPTALALAQKPLAFGVRWATYWTIAATQKGSPYYMSAIHCKADGEAVYLCNAQLLRRGKPNGRMVCMNLGIGNDGRLLTKAIVPCLPTA